MDALFKGFNMNEIREIDHQKPEIHLALPADLSMPLGSLSEQSMADENIFKRAIFIRKGVIPVYELVDII